METKGIFRITLLTGVVLLFISLFSFAEAPASTPASECAATIWQKFQGNIKYPDYAYKQSIQGDVIVIFTVADDGKIIVKDIRATDEDLGKYVREVMTRMQCPELDNASVYDFKVIFHFKLI
jgi:Gram-negative bacterial TonB protein C-terminal